MPGAAKSTRVGFDIAATRRDGFDLPEMLKVARFNMSTSQPIGPSSLVAAHVPAAGRPEQAVVFERMFSGDRLEERDIRFFKETLGGTAQDVLEIAKRQFTERGNADRVRFAARLLAAYPRESARPLQEFLARNSDLTVYFVGLVCDPGRFSEEQQIALLAEIVRTADEDTAEQVFGCVDWLPAPVTLEVLKLLARRGGVDQQEVAERLSGLS